jgi:hypothetical protein
MRLCIFAEIEFLTAITTFELLASFFHLGSPRKPLKRNGCASVSAAWMAHARRPCFTFANRLPYGDPFLKLARYEAHGRNTRTSH